MPADDNAAIAAVDKPANTKSAAHSERLHAYAKLLLEVGVNLQPGQKLLLRAPTDALELARIVVDQAYRRGSPFVEVIWNDDSVTRSRFLHAPDDSFSTISRHRAQLMIDLANEGAASLAITSEDPDMLAGVDQSRMASYLKAWRPAIKPYYDIAMRDGVAWSVGAAAAPAWAKRVFPHLGTDEAVHELWKQIFAATRVTADDPVAAWREHASVLGRVKERLNSKRYAALRFRGPGTDLRVGLADGHRWDGGTSHTPDGTPFMANMPTEEVFTAPHRARVDGVVTATKPLAHSGTIIDGFELRFENGVVVSATARQGQATLDQILSADEGARRLGEVALVPASSPIAKTGVLFYETLFDENAASHIALGRAYDSTVEGARGMSDDEKLAAGLNQSLTHVDFMIGSAQVDVDGEADDGTLEPVMRAGEWVA